MTGWRGLPRADVAVTGTMSDGPAKLAIWHYP